MLKQVFSNFVECCLYGGSWLLMFLPLPALRFAFCEKQNRFLGNGHMLTGVMSSEPSGPYVVEKVI